MEIVMRKEYDIEKLNPRRNPYARQLKKQVTMYVDQDNIDYFKKESLNAGIPCQTLINLYLSDCKKNKRKLNLEWK